MIAGHRKWLSKKYYGPDEIENWKSRIFNLYANYKKNNSDCDER